MLNTLQPAAGSVKNKKRKARGQGSGMGKTASRGHGGQKSRSGGNVAPGFEGGQQPMHKRLPKVGFRSRVVKPTSVNVEKFPAIKEMKEITVAALVEAGAISDKANKVKLIGSSAKNLASKIKDENITTTGK
ncbi:MAG: 50S ribosomal protein L15 [Campylobacterales bacterium]|nr:50S ribosomal protein L15 [Campylobacterales bacterium]